MDAKTTPIVVYRMNIADRPADEQMEEYGYDVEHRDVNLSLYIRRDQATSPPWAAFVAPYLTDEKKIVNTKSSFVFFFERGEYCYALAGGNGFHRLKAICEDDFGLEVAVRLIDDGKISSLNQKPLGGSTTQVFRTVRGYDPQIDIENYDRLLKFIEGQGLFGGRSFKVRGRSSLVLRTDKPITEFAHVVQEIEDTLTKVPKIGLPRNYRIVDDPELIAELESRLDQEFRLFWEGASRELLYAEFDDPLQQTHAVCFSIRCGRIREDTDDFELETLRDKLRFRGIADSDLAFTKTQVAAKNEDGFAVAKIGSLRQSMTFETTLGFKTFLKHGRSWLEILDELKQYIDGRLQAIPIHQQCLPAWLPDEPEKAYNLRVANDRGYVCMDRELVSVEGRSRVELCDLYDPSLKKLYHVKRTWGSKSTYLFLQASTAAQSLAQNRSFREKCAEIWPDHFDGSSKINATFVIAIAATAAQLATLPCGLSYFAKHNLLQAISKIQDAGFGVEIATIESLK